MSRAMTWALKAGAIGVLLGIFFVLRDNLALWQESPNLDIGQAIARVLGGAVGGGVLFALGGYVFGLSRRSSS